jgi:hypothetical protein
MAGDEVTDKELVDLLVKENLIMKKKLKFLQEEVLPKAAAALQGQYRAWCDLESITADAMTTVTALLENKDGFWPES